MNSKIYGKLAVTNLKNNKKSYIPYILASAFSVMMYFIMDNLYRNRSLVEKGSPLAIMLSYAAAVILIFSIIFLFYINSFLIKRRKKELGIYNILGMGKGHLGKMLFLESVITTVASIIGGILAGILLGKLVYLILLKILHMGGKIEYRISLASTGMTTILFGADERRMELAFEGQRWYDLCRLNKVEEVMNAVYAKDSGRHAQENLFNENSYLLAIPQGAIDQNENLIQNPGY